MSATRIQWIDTAKLIGIFLVILGHIPLQDSTIIDFIYSFHMPLFFFISGITTKEESFYTSLRKNTKHLLIPYVFFYLLSCVRYILRHLSAFSEDSFGITLKLLLGLILGVGYDTDYSIMSNHHLWFIVALFSCKIFFSSTNNMFEWKKTVIHIIFMMCFMAIVSWLSKNKILLPFSIGSAFLAYPFFLCGHIFGQLIIHELQKIDISKKIILFGLILIVELCMLKLNGHSDINTLKFGNNIFLFYIKGFLGISLIILSSNFIPSVKKLDIFAQNTIIILAFHSITSGIMLFLCDYFKLISDVQSVYLLFALLVTICSLVLNYIPIIIITKICPWVLGKKSK